MVAPHYIAVDKPARSDVLFPHAGSLRSKYTNPSSGAMVGSNPAGGMGRVFIGRQTELSELEANLAEAIAGRPEVSALPSDVCFCDAAPSNSRRVFQVFVDAAAFRQVREGFVPAVPLSLDTSHLPQKVGGG